VTGVAWALLSPQLGAAILPSDTISNWWHDSRQSDTEEAVERYVDEVQDAAIRAQPPKISVSPERERGGARHVDHARRQPGGERA
jgi:hypothetical protein